jgi:hypothetical protein
MARVPELAEVFIVSALDFLEQMQLATGELVFHDGSIAASHLHIAGLTLTCVRVFSRVDPAVAVAKLFSTWRAEQKD